jgi:hypothetical protein
MEQKTWLKPRRFISDIWGNKPVRIQEKKLAMLWPVFSVKGHRFIGFLSNFRLAWI